MKLSIFSVLHLGVKVSKNFNCNFRRGIYMLNREPSDLDITDSNRVSETIIKNKLKAFSVPFTDGFTCFCINGCGLCSQTLKKYPSDHSGIYINKRTGFFLCDKCRITGSWQNFAEFLHNTKNQSGKNIAAKLSDKNVKYNVIMDKWIAVTKTSKLTCELEEKTYKNIFKDFNLTPVSKINSEKIQLRISADENELYLPLFSSQDCIVGYKSYSKNGVTNTFPGNECFGLLSSNTKKKTAAVVANVPDFFALLSQDLPIQILCLPYGISNLPQSTLPFLEHYEKLILWLGGGTALDVTGNFARKLNEKRCFIVKPTSKQISPVTALSKGENIAEILKGAKSAWHEFIIQFNSLREEVLAELQNRDQCAGILWKRFPGLNKILKGHRRGELTILTGPTGSGKTTFISEYSLDLALQGVNTLWGSFEIKNSRLAKRMLQQYAQMPLEENLDKFHNWADKFEQLPIYFMTFHGQQSLKNVMDTVQHSSYVHDIAHVIIDNVQFMIEVSPEAMRMDRFWKQDILVQEFRSFASRYNCHVTLVMHPKKGMDGVELGVNSIFGGAKAAQEADNILIIQHGSDGFGQSRKMLQISKNRFSGDLGGFPLKFNKSSFGFSNTSEESYEQNNEVDDLIEVDVKLSDEEITKSKWRLENTWNRLMRV